MRVAGTCDILTSGEVELIYRDACRILDEVGMLVEDARIKSLLREYGAHVTNGDDRVFFPTPMVQSFLDTASSEYDVDVRGTDNSCTLPFRDRASNSNGVECTAGTYPTSYLGLDNTIHPHTLESVAQLTRLADHLPNIDRIGAMGIPSDIPAELAPLYQRVIAWKNARRKRSGCGEIQNRSLVPYIIEMGEVIAECKNSPPRTYTFGEVGLISPLKFAKEEAGIFADLWEEGYLCGVGFMHIAGATAPATLAGTLALDLAENIFINMLYRYCHGLKKLWFQTNASVLDMKTGMFPFGRPERGLLMLAVGQIARHFRAGLWASAIYPDAKAPTCEAGMQSAFNVIPAILAGSLGLECFGLLSGAEVNSPIQLVIDNEYAGALKRFARGFAINEDTLAFDVIKDLGPAGFFAATEHTVAHYRTEHWQPTIFSRETLNSWLASGRKNDVDLAREVCEDIFSQPFESNISDEVESALLDVIQRAKGALLGQTAGRRSPALLAPEKGL